MQIIKIAILLLFFVYVAPAVAQTDSNVVKVDSAMRGNKEPSDTVRTAEADSARIIGAARADTAVRSDAGKRPAKKEVVKDPARLALEAMPRKAVMRSLIIPGWGQIYNKRWWKVPLVYGGYVGIGLVYEFNQRYYKEFLEEAQYRSLNNGQGKNPKYLQYDLQAITDAKDFYRRNRDLSILAGIAFHAIQMIDAYVDAKFFRFDIGDDLSLKVAPDIQRQSIYNAYTPIPSLKIKLSL